jgi:hypothetical protein
MGWMAAGQFTVDASFAFFSNHIRIDPDLHFSLAIRRA